MSLITKERFIAYARLIRLDKPIGTLLLLWPTLWGIWLAADGMPDGMILFIFILRPGDVSCYVSPKDKINHLRSCLSLFDICKFSRAGSEKTY